jgi:hypothetical protein
VFLSCKLSTSLTQNQTSTRDKGAYRQCTSIAVLIQRQQQNAAQAPDTGIATAPGYTRQCKRFVALQLLCVMFS